MCSLYEERIERLLLTEPNLDPATKGSTSWAVVQAVAQYTEENYKKSITRLIQYCESGKNTMWAATLKNWLPEAAHQISRDAVVVRENSWRSLLYSYNVPRYFIFGEKTLPSMDFEELSKHNITVKVVKNAEHSMAWENPEELVEVISSCL